MTASVHAAARLCAASVARAMAHLTSARGMSCWNLGLRNCRELEPGFFTGESLFDGAQGWVRVRALAELDAAEYWVGSSPDHLMPRIHARVVAGERLGHEPGSSVVTLLAWRPHGMSDDRWSRLVTTHETEIQLIQAQLSAEQRR